MTADNKNWPLLQRLPSQKDNKGGAGSPAVSDVHEGIERPQPQHLNRSSSGNRLLLSRLNTGSITPPRHWEMARVPANWVVRIILTSSE